VDALVALAASCTAATSGPRLARRRAAASVVLDAAVAFALVLAHGFVLMAQAMVFGVAMNSKKNTLVALLIASNFTEVKGKRAVHCRITDPLLFSMYFLCSMHVPTRILCFSLCVSLS
jgi:hypothetical protein